MISKSITPNNNKMENHNLEVLFPKKYRFKNTYKVNLLLLSLLNNIRLIHHQIKETLNLTRQQKISVVKILKLVDLLKNNGVQVMKELITVLMDVFLIGAGIAVVKNFMIQIIHLNIL